MSYVIRNIRPSVIHIPDAGLRLDSGQTAIVDTLSPQMDELLANRALEAISSDPDPPVATVTVAEECVPTPPEELAQKIDGTANILPEADVLAKDHLTVGGLPYRVKS